MAESLAALVKRVNALTAQVATDVDALKTLVTSTEERVAALEAAPAPIPEPVDDPPPIVVDPVPAPAPVQVIQVAIYVPPFELGSSGLLWVSVMGSASFDTATIDPASVTLGDGAGKDVKAMRRAPGVDYNGDGFADAPFEFSIPQLEAVGAVTSPTSRLVLRGSTPAGAFSGASDGTALAPAPTPVPTPVPEPTPTPAPSDEFATYPSAGAALICGPQLISGSSLNPWPWFDSNAIDTGHRLGAAFPAGAQSADDYVVQNYYDQGFVQYLNYYRTGDVRFRDYARKITDGWWLVDAINGGTQLVDKSFAPRMIAMDGLMLRALDGRPEMWEWMVAFNEYMVSIFLDRAVRLGNTTLVNGARDPGYVLRFATLLSEVLPDRYPKRGGGEYTDGAATRANLRARVESAAVSWFAKVQYPDGSWRITELDQNTFETMYVFHMGLLTEGLVALHQVTQDASVKSTIQGSIIRFITHLYQNVYRKDELATATGLKWRSVWYFFGGGSTADHTAYERGGGSGPWPESGTGPTSAADVTYWRQLNCMLCHVFGYAFKITGDAKYKAWGDDVFSATYGKGQGPGADAAYSLVYTNAKNYDQGYRSAGRYLAYRAGA